MMPRRVPPVYSPISARALWRGFRAALSPAAAARARAELDEWVRQTYRPAEWLWTDSGTSALTLALRIAKAAGRRRVALPAYGCYDLATACDGAGVEVALYDVDPETLGPDWGSLEQVLDGGADILLVAHLYGLPVDLGRATRLASRFGAVLVEDAAQGVGASWAGRPLGANGDLGVLSFGRGKGLTAGGGGLLLAGPEWGERLRAHSALRKGGRGLTGLAKSLAQWAFATPSMYWIPAGLPFLGLGETVYRGASEPAAMSRSGGGILAETTSLISAEAQTRRGHGEWWRERLHGDTHLQTPAVASSACSGDLRFPVLRGSARAGGLWSPSAAPLGVARGYPLSLDHLEGFGSKWAGSSRFPGANRIAAELVTIPTHSLVSEDDVTRLDELLGEKPPLTPEDRERPGR